MPAVKTLPETCLPFTSYLLRVIYVSHTMVNTYQLSLLKDNGSWVTTNYSITDSLSHDEKAVKHMLFKHFLKSLSSNGKHHQAVVSTLNVVLDTAFPGVDSIKPVKTIKPGFNFGEKIAMMGGGTVYMSTIGGDESGISLAAGKLPGIYTRVKIPCDCGWKYEVSIKECVIHLNDTHHWDRNKVANWLDRLHDDGMIDIEFKTEEPVDEESVTVEFGPGWKYVGHASGLSINDGMHYSIYKETNND